MMDQTFSTKSGVKARTIEAESSGGLVEIDLREIKQTADGTYLIQSRDLQAVGKWALTIEVAQAKKEGKPVPPELEKDLDKATLFLNDIMEKIPVLVKTFKDLKNDRVHPVQKGLEKGIMDAATELTQEILATDPELKEALHETIKVNLEQALGFRHDGDQEGA